MITTDDRAVSVDLARHGVRLIGNINRGKRALPQPEAVGGFVGQSILPDDVARRRNAPALGPNRSRIVKGSESTIAQQEAMFDIAIVHVATNDFTTLMNTRHLC